MQEGGGGYQIDVVKQEVTRKKDKISSRRTTKAAMLQGDTECPDLVDSSIYDTRPVHFLSMGCNSIKWVIKSKRVYSVDSGEVELMDFLRLNHIDDYNNTTGGFDISDQLRGTH